MGWKRHSLPLTRTEAVDGVGSTRARICREALRRLQEVDMVDRYLQTNTTAVAIDKERKEHPISELAEEAMQVVSPRGR